MFAAPRRPPNTAWFAFLDPRAPVFFSTGSGSRTTPSPILRVRGRADPHDRDLSDLVGELSTQSELFRTLWAAHDVRNHDTGSKRFHHPVVGDLDLTSRR